MRLYKAPLIVTSALVAGVFFSWLWWEPEVGRLMRKLTAASSTCRPLG
jgi:hypothetical protein